MVTKLGEPFARALPHRSGLATASSATVPPCNARQRCSGHPPANPRVPLGAPRCGEHDGAHPVAGDHTADEIRSSEVPSLSITLTNGVGGRLSVTGGTEMGRDPGVFSVFHPNFELVFQKIIYRK